MRLLSRALAARLFERLQDFIPPARLVVHHHSQRLAKRRAIVIEPTRLIPAKRSLQQINCLKIRRGPS